MDKFISLLLDLEIFELHRKFCSWTHTGEFVSLMLELSKTILHI